MTEEMTRWGVGPKFTLLSIGYAIPIFALSMYFKTSFKMDFIPYRMIATIAIVLILIGIPFYIIAAVTLTRAFNAGKLVTSGAFGICRHPIYASWIIFIVPGIALLLNSWIALTIPVMMYLFLRLLVRLVRKEEMYLEKTFSNEYTEYKRKIPAVLPIGWIKSNRHFQR